MNYTYFADLFREFELPAQGILSRVLHKDERLNITAFGFSSGEELSPHSAPTPAVLYFLEGEGVVQLGTTEELVHAGSFVFMPPNLPHGIRAKTGLRMLLVQIKMPPTETDAP
jgi:quercetin dioxygenase-like cupin family protein